MAELSRLTAPADTDRVARRFSRHAATYDRYATVQHAMARELARDARSLAPDARDILELGCGTGRLTSLLLRTFPEARITAVDVAAGMLEEASAKAVGSDPRALLVHDDIETMELPPDAYDLVVSNATLQWLERPRETPSALRRSLRPGGLMLHTTFGPRTFGELHSAFASAERARGFEPTLHGLALAPVSVWERRLRAAGLVNVSCSSRLRQVEYAGCRALLEAIKRTGASAGPALDGGRALLLPEVIRRYDDAFRSAWGVYATYELLTLSGTTAPA
jgi:malonyl-CoA O-methyltransferase